MVPTSFIEANQFFDWPVDMTDDECGPLDTWKGLMQVDDSKVPVIVSCFKMTAEELIEVNRTGRVWVYNWGTKLQPHSLSGISPFGESNG